MHKRVLQYTVCLAQSELQRLPAELDSYLLHCYQDGDTKRSGVEAGGRDGQAVA